MTMATVSEPLDLTLERNKRMAPTKAVLKRQGKARADNIRNLLESITAQFDTIAVQLAEVKYDEAEWKAMGYDTFAEYIHGEYNEHLLRLAPAVRKAIGASKEVKQAGLTQPEIAALTGSSVRTAQRDKAESESRVSRQVAGNTTGEVGNDGLVVLDDPDATPVTTPDLKATTTCQPFDHWEALAHALLSFTRSHEDHKPTEKEIRTITGRIRKVARIMEGYNAS